MSKAKMQWGVLAVSALLLGGCGSGLTVVEPRVLAPNELTLRYDNEFQVWSPKGPVATGVRYDGLTDYVDCVPEARRHAIAAESAGNTAVGLTVAGITLAVGGLGGLAGLASDNPNVVGGLLLGGVGVEVLALVLTAVGRTYKVDANGHAVDAMNYYNDAVGSRGGRCAARRQEIPATQTVDAPEEPDDEADEEPEAPAQPAPPGPIRPVPVDPNQPPAMLPPERVILPD